MGCVAVGAVLLVGRPVQSEPSSTAPAGVSLAGIPVAGKTREEVAGLANDLTGALLRVPVTVTFKNHSEKTTPSRLGAAVDRKAAVDAVFTLPPPGNVFEQIRERFTGPPARDVQMPVAVPEAGVAKGLARFSVRIGAEPRSARLTKVDGKFKRIPPRPGKELDSSKIAGELEQALNNPDTLARAAAGLQSDSAADSSAAPASQPTALTIALKAATREAQPRITLEQLLPITARLASFNTGLGSSSRNRVHNIRLASRAIDGTVLLPGDVFSYNEIVGPRVPSAGFREAPVIVKGELQPGTGGGICQVSSTLYNAVLLADLKVIRRSHHAFPVHYVPAGRDATVVDGAIDFRFANSLEHPVAIDAKVAGHRVVFHIYGHPDDRRKVEIVSSGISYQGAGLQTIADPRLPRGRRVVDKRAHPGRRVTTSRIVKKDGELLRKEVLSRDYYRPFSGVVRVGTRGPAPAAKPAPGKPMPQPPSEPAPGPAAPPAGERQEASSRQSPR